MDTCEASQDLLRLNPPQLSALEVSNRRRVWNGHYTGVGRVERLAVTGRFV